MAHSEDSARKKPVAALQKRGLRRWGATALVPLLLACTLQARPGSEAVAALRAADAIFLGSLLEKDSLLSDDGRLIWTRHLFAVEDTIHGTPSETLEVFELGGTVGDLSLRVSHGVSYEWGESYLIFARRGVDGRLQTWGGPDGRLPILEDRSGKRLARVRAGSPLGAFLGGSQRAFYELDEIRAKLMTLRPETGEKR